MALIICPGCNKEISASFPSCIHCGRPIKIPKSSNLKTDPAQNTAELSDDTFKESESLPKKKRSNLKIFLYILGVFLVIGYFSDKADKVFPIPVEEVQVTKPQTETRKVAEQGYAHAQYSLGVMYDKGEGVRQNYSKAKEWYGKACNSGLQLGCDRYNEIVKMGY